MLPIIDQNNWIDDQSIKLLTHFFLLLFVLTSNYRYNITSYLFRDDADNDADKDADKDADNDADNAVLEYTDKYNISNLVEQDDLDVTKLENCVILEYTPIGMIYMIYKNDEFGYYSNTNITYNILDTVCRKFVKTFNCISLYNKLEEIQNTTNKNHKNNKNNKDDKDDKNESKQNKTINRKNKIFASFKKNETHKSVKKQMNVFRKLGALLDFKILKPISNNNNIKNITFADFKNMN